MELIEAIRSRQSVRGYKSTSVPKDILTEILNLARLAPSATNCQPWEFILLTGDSLQKAKQVNIEQSQAGAEIKPDFQAIPPNKLASPYVDRQNALAKGMFNSAKIQRIDREKREEWKQKGKRFFDAPAAILICADESILDDHHQIPLIDIGLVTQTITLAALEYNLGTCIQQDTIFYPGALKEALEIPLEKKLIVAIAIGYPDWDFPANDFRSERESLDSLTTWKS